MIFKDGALMTTDDDAIFNPKLMIIFLREARLSPVLCLSEWSTTTGHRQYDDHLFDGHRTH